MATDPAILGPQAYIPDPAEEAWYASPEGKRNTARLLRERAARLIAEADGLEAEAAAVERAGSAGE